MKTSVIRHCRAAATSFVLAAAALAAAAGCATRPATGSATVAVTRVVPSETEIPGRRLPFDPIFLRSQFDVIRSAPVLTPVVLSNDLGAVLDAAYGWHMACPDAAADRAVACRPPAAPESAVGAAPLVGVVEATRRRRRRDRAAERAGESADND